jgi:hypothetical protein
MSQVNNPQPGNIQTGASAEQVLMTAEISGHAEATALVFCALVSCDDSGITFRFR